MHPILGQPIRIYTTISELSSHGIYRNHGITKNLIHISILDDRNDTLNNKLYLRINNPHINKIIVYNKKLHNIVNTGDNYVFANRPIKVNDFIIPLEKFLNKGDTIELSLDKTSENVSYQLKIHNENEIDQLKSERMFYLGGSILFVVILIIYFIILGVLSNTSYNYLFAIYILTIVFWYLGNAGFLYQYCWPNNPSFHNISRTLFSTLAITAFSIFLLNYFKNSKNLFYLIILYTICIFMPIRIISISLSSNMIQNQSIKYMLLVINSFILSVLFLSIIVFLLCEIYKTKKWYNTSGYLLFSLSLFLEVGHQYRFDPFPWYHYSLFFPFLFFCGQILLIGTGNLVSFIKADKIIAERKYHDLIEIDNNLANTVIKVQEIERTIIGEELHDRIGADLSIIKLQAETLVKRYPLFIGKYELQNISISLGNLIKEIRFIISSLLPFDAENKKSEELFYSLINHFQPVCSFLIFLQYELQYQLPSRVNTQIYRILNELLFNTLKYSNCTQVRIRFFEEYAGITQFWYIENIKGFEHIEESGHFGIKNIKHRVSYLKGEITQHNTETEMIYKIKIPLND
jgi:signal transduction histidine kinase